LYSDVVTRGVVDRATGRRAGVDQEVRVALQTAVWNHVMANREEGYKQVALMRGKTMEEVVLARARAPVREEREAYARRKYPNGGRRQSRQRR